MYETLKALIGHEEGERLQVYDDATGQPITKGSVVKGYPTIGYGRLLCAPGGISAAESEAMFEADIERISGRVSALLSPWFAALSGARRDALLSIAFNAGVEGLMEFKLMLAACRGGQWEEAARQIISSRLPEGRKSELAALMLKG